LRCLLRDRKRDPFVPPYEEDLFVEWDFSVGPAHSPRSKHVLVLNKFNVLPNHALIVTTDFQVRLAGLLNSFSDDLQTHPHRHRCSHKLIRSTSATSRSSGEAWTT
jgi:hypothetical protein